MNIDQLFLEAPYYCRVSIQKRNIQTRGKGEPMKKPHQGSTISTVFKKTRGTKFLRERGRVCAIDLENKNNSLATDTIFKTVRKR